MSIDVIGTPDSDHSDAWAKTLANIVKLLSFLFLLPA